MRRVTGARWTVLSAALLLPSIGVPAGEKNEARQLFDKMEKKLAEADTLSLTSHGKLKLGDQEGTVKATLLLAQGNKVRVDLVTAGNGKSAEVSMVSDGNQMSTAVAGKPSKETQTPKYLKENLVYTLSRVGLTPALMTTKKRDENKPQQDSMPVSDFKLDKRDELDGRTVHVLHYQVGFTGQDKKFAATLYLDLKTLLPVRRTIAAIGLSEEYQWRLNEKIPEERFALPK
jgi:outer membrane lipoprotein-sorting protein